ncbi:MAG TPA: tetratricopeptide repeat protein, partial [Pirellulaceae bacterium]
YRTLMVVVPGSAVPGTVVPGSPTPDWAAWSVAARCTCRLDRPEEARQLWESMMAREQLRVPPADDELLAQWRLVRVYQEMGRHEEALRELARIRQLDVSSAGRARSWDATAVSYSEMHRPSECQWARDKAALSAPRIAEPPPAPLPSLRRT